MRRPAFRKATRGSQVSTQYSLPAPVGGWNARDSVANMAETDAVTLENWFPYNDDVSVRQGFSDHVTGLTGDVETLAAYNKPDGTATLFAFANNAIYDVTTSGTVGAAVVSGLSSNRWQCVNNTLSGGTSYLCCFNGEDDPQYYNGSSWISITGASSPAITGLTTSDIVHATVHKRRMWLVEKNSLDAWYLPVDSVGGEARKWSLSGICKRGGYIVAIGTWTLDSGDGIDDAWVAITSEGQIVVATGIDPSSAATWGITGVWDVGRPIGRRCMLKYKGDILLILRDGVFPLSVALIGSQTAPDQALTYKINKAMTTAAFYYGETFGWELFHYPDDNQLILNIPVTTEDSYEQYVMNTISGAWCRFTGVDAKCWALLGNDAYYGSNTKVIKYADGVYVDNATNIEADMQQAFSYFGERGRLKHFKMMRPVLQIGGAIDSLISVNLDYDNTEPSGSLTVSPPSQSLWDTAVWDSGTWGGLITTAPWQTVIGVGTAGSVRFKVQSQSETRLQATDHVFEYGGVIG